MQDHSAFLIIKTSSLGDILQTFPAVALLHRFFPYSAIDWVVESRFAPLLEAHPHLHRVIAMRIKEVKEKKAKFSSLKSDFSTLRKTRYTALFDLQGNCKSGILSLLSKSERKIGFKNPREWPNRLFSQEKYEVCPQDNMRLQYASLIAQAMHLPLAALPLTPLTLRLSLQEQDQLAKILQNLPSKTLIMLCPGSNWTNKCLSFKQWDHLLTLLTQNQDLFFVLSWGTPQEYRLGVSLSEKFPSKILLLPALSIPLWQQLMTHMDLILSMDSGALHLAGTTGTPSLSIFGPTASSIFQPLETDSTTLQGPCPYNQTFIKQCPLLRTCKAGDCIKQLDPKNIAIITQQLIDRLHRNKLSPKHRRFYDGELIRS